jgi:nucleoside 2-deoxyribosyltransferase
MKVFISYRFTGEKLEDLKALLSPIQKALEEKGASAYCNLSDPELEERSKNFAPEDYVFDAFKILDTCQMLFVVITSESKSEGMILEVGYAIAKGIPVIVALKEGVGNTYLPGMARQVIKWSDVDDLKEKIKEVTL